MTEKAPAPEGMKGARFRSFSAFLAAIQFLTVAPPIIRRPFSLQELGEAVGFYPLVGLLMGLILVCADYLLAYLLPAQVRTALILALWVGLSGALHVDGFLDTCDGLLGGHSPESRLEIMRDERVGAFALAGGILLFLVKFTALSAIFNRTGALLLAPTLGRWGMSMAVVAFPYARPQGLGRDIKDHASWKQVILSTLISLVIAWFAAGLAGLLACVLAVLAAWGVASFAIHRIHGLTGDIYGAINELVEVAVLLTLVAGPQRLFF